MTQPNSHAHLLGDNLMFTRFQPRFGSINIFSIFSRTQYIMVTTRRANALVTEAANDKISEPPLKKVRLDKNDSKAIPGMSGPSSNEVSAHLTRQKTFQKSPKSRRNARPRRNYQILIRFSPVSRVPGRSGPMYLPSVGLRMRL